MLSAESNDTASALTALIKIPSMKPLKEMLHFTKLCSLQIYIFYYNTVFWVQQQQQQQQHRRRRSQNSMLK